MAHADDVLGRKAAFGILAIFPQRYGVFGFYEFTELGSFEGVGGMGCQRFEDLDVLIIECPFVLVDRFANANHLSLQVSQSHRQQSPRPIPGLEIDLLVKQGMLVSIGYVDSLACHRDLAGNAQPGIEAHDFILLGNHRPELAPFAIE